MSVDNEALTTLFQKLREPFPSEAISQLSTNWGTADYVGHAYITERLNEVDPTWSWEPFAVDDDGCPLVREKGDQRELWINLTVGGITRPGVGTASVDAHSGETSKELISDALRNGAMRFGVALDLWKRSSDGASNSGGGGGVSNSRQATESSGSSGQTSRNQPARSAGPITDGQSRNLYRLWHHVLKLDKVEYLNEIMIATGLEVDDDRDLDSKSASMVIQHLKEMAGEPVEDARGGGSRSAPVAADDGDPGPTEPSSSGWDGEPF